MPQTGRPRSPAALRLRCGRAELVVGAADRDTPRGVRAGGTAPRARHDRVGAVAVDTTVPDIPVVVRRVHDDRLPAARTQFAVLGGTVLAGKLPAAHDSASSSFAHAGSKSGCDSHRRAARVSRRHAARALYFA